MLLDSYAWVEFLNASEKGTAVAKIIRENDCFTSSISIAEISEWIERENLNREKTLQVIRENSRIIEASQEVMELAGILKVVKRKEAKNFGMIDAIILATAKQYNLKIVTGDRHFAGENCLFL